MAALVETMYTEGFAQPVLVISNKPGAGGLAKAEALGVPSICMDHKAHDGRAPFEAALTETLDAVAPDVICLAGFIRVLTEEFTSRWAGKILNIHPSILPLFPGLHTHQRVLEAGMAVHGCTVHEVTGELDAGPILGQAIIPVEREDTPEMLAARLLPKEHALYPAALKRFIVGDRASLALL